MTDQWIVEGEVDEQGQLVVKLPEDAPRGKVRVTVESIFSHPDAKFRSEEERQAWIEMYDPELEELLASAPPNGYGLTAGEIAQSPEIGAWSDRTDIISGEDYVEKIRKGNRYQW
jgi:RecB family endonuclease NucS